MAFLDFLTDLFGGKSSQAPSTGGGESSWIGPLISALGTVASRAKWTPREDATASDIREANRNNLIAQLLGAGAQAYGGYRKQQAYGDLADIFKSGGMTTTTGTLPVAQSAVGAPSSVSERLFEWGQKNPEFGDVAVKFGLKQMGAEQEEATKLEAARIKANQPPSFQEMAAADAYYRGLIPDPEERQRRIAEDFAARGKSMQPLGQIGATAQPTPPILGMDFTQQAQPATPPYDVEALREAGKRWQGGEEGINITFPKGTDIEEVTQAIEDGRKQSDQYPGSVGRPPVQETYPKSEEIRRQTQQRQEEETSRARRRDEREERAQIEKPFADTMQKGLDAANKYAIIEENLALNNFGATQTALKTLIQSIDNSVVHPSEQSNANAQFLTARDMYRMWLSDFAGKKRDFPPAAKKQILDIARNIRDINENSARIAESTMLDVLDKRLRGERVSVFNIRDNILSKYSTGRQYAQEMRQMEETPSIRGITNNQSESNQAGRIPQGTRVTYGNRRLQAID